MQGFGCGRGSNSTVDNLNLYHSSTPENYRASSPATLVEYTPALFDAPSVSDISSVFYVPSANASIWPWWEAEAENILRGPNLHAIQLLCRFHIYKDDSIPESALRKRWRSRLNSFLIELCAGTNNCSDVAALDQDQMVQEILKRLVPSVPVAHTCRDLVSSTLLLEPDVTRLASKLNNESSLRFQNVTFADYIKEALYPEENIESIIDFNDWHDSLFNIVSDRLEKFPAEAVKYAQIEQVCAAPITRPLLTRAAVTRREPCALGGLRKPAADTVS
ncbi:MAG: hypothetical protein Q9163_000116 [Psora crenata]